MDFISFSYGFKFSFVLYLVKYTSLKNLKSFPNLFISLKLTEDMSPFFEIKLCDSETN